MARRPKEETDLINEYRSISIMMRKHIREKFPIDMDLCMKRMIEIEIDLESRGYITCTPARSDLANKYGPGYFTFHKTP